MRKLKIKIKLMEGDGLRRSLLFLTVEKYVHPEYFQEKNVFSRKK